ncbi:hypothetical protein HAX54_044786, partial [Datura stramonium]|nr:hypothetical protein [Datura stramonium]
MEPEGRKGNADCAGVFGEEREKGVTDDELCLVVFTMDSSEQWWKGDGRGARQKAAADDVPELMELGEERKGSERRRSSGWLFGGGSPEVEEQQTREIWWWRPEAKGEMERFWVKGKVRGEGRENIGAADSRGERDEKKKVRGDFHRQKREDKEGVQGGVALMEVCSGRCPTAREGEAVEVVDGARREKMRNYFWFLGVNGIFKEN